MTHLDPSSGDPRITAALALMAAFRQAEVGERTLDLYSAQLTADRYAVDAIEAACHIHGQAERKEGETAFPSIGQLKGLIEQIERNRREAAQARLLEEQRKLLPARTEGTEQSDARAKVWLDRIKHTAHYGGTLAEAMALYPMPEEVPVGGVRS